MNENLRSPENLEHVRSLFSKLDRKIKGKPNPLYLIVDEWLDQNDPQRADEREAWPPNYK